MHKEPGSKMLEAILRLQANQWKLDSKRKNSSGKKIINQKHIYAILDSRQSYRVSYASEPSRERQFDLVQRPKLDHSLFWLTTFYATIEAKKDRRSETWRERDTTTTTTWLGNWNNCSRLNHSKAPTRTFSCVNILSFKRLDWVAQMAIARMSSRFSPLQMVRFQSGFQSIVHSSQVMIFLKRARIFVATAHSNEGVPSSLGLTSLHCLIQSLWSGLPMFKCVWLMIRISHTQT